MIRSLNCSVLTLLTAALLASGIARAADNTAAFRPPAVPLITFDPYLSIWSEADRLTDDITRHWTHHEHSLISLILIDGQMYSLMGKATIISTQGVRQGGLRGVDEVAPPPYWSVQAFPQVGLQVLPTRSIYDFDDGHVHVTLTFMTAALPHDLDVLTRPLSYITWSIRSVDGAFHEVSLYDSVSSQLAVNSPDQKVVWGRERAGSLTALKVGTEAQPILQTSGDDVRIDWGYAYLAAPRALATTGIGSNRALTDLFARLGDLPGQDQDEQNNAELRQIKKLVARTLRMSERDLTQQDDARMPRAVKDDTPVLGVAFKLGPVGATPATRHVIVAYDEVYAINYFGRRLRPYWRRNGATPADLLQAAERDYPSLVRRCTEFDHALMADLTKTGGARYAQIAALAYRECLAGTGIAADANGQPLLFTKENTSNGDIATVDVIFPMDPMLILFSPTLAKASLVPDLAYAASGRWKFPNAPHDLGTYPIVRGTDDGGEGMPVEESGNMLLLCDAIAQEEGKPDFVAPWWPQLTQWAHYLEQYGNDPEDQLCTDDFMGHLAHNANLSIKAILAVAAYGDLCRRRGDTQTADRYQNLAKGYAQHWVEVAADGDHSRLAFDKPNSWSQKYNLVWDRILGLNVFPPTVAQQEIAFYKSVLQPYGVPLDSRTHLTKTDWSLWSATLADSREDFEKLVSPIYDYLNATTARSPLVDSYVTDDIKSDGMHARPVVGGLFVKMLAHPAMWKKWSSGDRMHVGGWAPIPAPPKITEVVPTGWHAAITWRYTTALPPDGWVHPGFDDSAWQEGPAGFGTAGTPGIVVHTTWSTDDIWLRRQLTMPAGAHSNLQFIVFHDEDVEIYVNGVLAAKEAGYITAYQPLDIAAPAKALLKPGAKITLAVHCHQTTGGQGIDVGLADVTEAK